MAWKKPACSGKLGSNAHLLAGRTVLHGRARAAWAATLGLTVARLLSTALITTAALRRRAGGPAIPVLGGRARPFLAVIAHA